MKREQWKSQMGFILSSVGSAIGLANIWRFPYLVGRYGGAAFVFVYLISLCLIGFPIFVSEVMIGRRTHKNPRGAFHEVGKGRVWTGMGMFMVVTGFLVSSFYSVVAGWIFGYFVEAISGNLVSFNNVIETREHFSGLISSTWWSLGFHLLFIILCISVLRRGVRRGIEFGNKIFMPVLFVILIILVVKGLFSSNAAVGLEFLFAPDWSVLTPMAIVMALGHSFFTLSIGQGTMITYGSYLSDKSNIPKSGVPIALADTMVSLLGAIAIFTIAFSVGVDVSGGPGLIFQTLPLVFSQIPGGNIVAVLFFLLVGLAALTSEISAMEPMIAYLIDEKGFKRRSAVFLCAAGAFVLGIPSALAYGVLSNISLADKNILDMMDFITTGIMIPVGGFFSVVLVGWRWGFHRAFKHLRKGAEELFDKRPFVGRYFWFCIKYVAPVLMIVVFLHSVGILQ